MLESPLFKYRMPVIVIVAAVLSLRVASAGDEPLSAFDQGQVAMAEADYARAAALFREAIDAEPHNFKAHQSYLNASSLEAVFGVDPELDDAQRSEMIKRLQATRSERMVRQYSHWAEQDPDSPIYRWALGELHMNIDYGEVERFMLEAIRLDSNFAPAYQTLALIEDVRGNPDGQQAYLRRATQVAPDDPDVAFYHAMLFRNGDYAALTTAVGQIVERFPDHERGAQALYWLADETRDANRKIAIIEELLALYPFEDFSWSASAMSMLFEQFAKTDPVQALQVAERMAASAESGNGSTGGGTWWTELREYQERIVEVNRLIADDDLDAALALLDATEKPRGTSPDPYVTARTHALSGARSAAAAYEYLLGVVAETPTDRSRALLESCAEELGFAAARVRADLAELHVAAAEPLDDFLFERIDTDETISLSDYRGKVVLLNFWYPFCGPCRGENPRLQQILDKYADRGFAVLALNVHPDEEEFVMPYLSGNKFDFLPLRSSEDFARENFQARGYPTNILVDTKGRMIGRVPPVRGDSARTLELRIEALLAAADAT